MSVNDESTGSRQFMASSAAFSSRWIKGTRYWQAGYAVLFAGFVLFLALQVFRTLGAVHLRLPHIGRVVIVGLPVGMLVVGVAIAAYLFWRSRRTYLITVTAISSPSMGGAVTPIHSSMRRWGFGWTRGSRFICTAAVSASFWADEVVASARRHGSMRRRCRSCTPGFRRQTSMSCSCWAAGLLRADPHRESRLAVCCFPTRCRSRDRLHSGKNND